MVGDAPRCPTASDYEVSIARAKQWLDTNGFPDSGFASAGGTLNPEVTAAVRKYHAYNRVSWGPESLPVQDPYLLHVGYSADYATDIGPFRAVLDQAVAERSWVIVLDHGWTPPGEFFPSMFNEIKARGIRVATVRDVLGGPYTVEAKAYDGAGNASVATSTVTTDRTPPTISDIRVSGLGANRATIEWTTSEPTKGRVEYGPTTSYGSATPTETVLSTSHSVTLTGLNPETTYQYRLSSADDLGNQATPSAASFTTPIQNTYTLTYTAGAGGTISGTTPQYGVVSGQSGTPVTAVPDTGYHFVSWSDGIMSATRTETNVTADKSVTANFAINTYTLSYAAGPGGTLLGATSQTVDYGTLGTAVTAVADTGYHFVSWSDGVMTATRNDAGAANLSVTATFAINTYTLTYTAGCQRHHLGHEPPDRQPRVQRHDRDRGACHRLPLRELVRRREHRGAQGHQRDRGQDGHGHLRHQHLHDHRQRRRPRHHQPRVSHRQPRLRTSPSRSRPIPATTSRRSPWTARP